MLAKILTRIAPSLTLVADWCTEFEKLIALRSLHPKTINKRKRNLAHLKQAIGHIRIRAVRPIHIAQAVHALWQSGRQNTARRVLLEARECFAEAVAAGLIGSNPAVSIKPLPVTIRSQRMRLEEWQALYDECLPPIGTKTLVETNGFLHIPGMSLGPRIPMLRGEKLQKAIEERSNLLEAFGQIITGVLNPSMHKCPNLAMRWLTALDWFAEGNRELNDAIAVVKFGACLDILSGAGGKKGILRMTENLTGKSRKDIVVTGKYKLNLTNFIDDIYTEGRSKIVHGNHYDRLESFETTRKYAGILSNIALSESAIRLQNYSGADDNRAFQKM
ncbi:MAG: hypothetical protein NC211_07740 [Alistipes senegalensis]|nr:hypothetical protein [Oxalobacter formigenes]MCM1281699.1 hypothetical protein [Alistipes senegalensis]